MPKAHMKAGAKKGSDHYSRNYQCSGEACQGQGLSGWNASQACGAEWRAC